MSERSVSVPTRGLASLLGALQPRSLERLRERFPHERELFETSYALGAQSGAAASDHPPGPDRQAAVRALIEETLAASRPAIPLMVEKISARMRSARTARLAGAVAATLGSALIATQAAGALPGSLQLLWSAVSLAGALLVLWGEHLEKPVIGGQRTLGELLSEVLVAESAIAEIRLRLLAEDAEQPAILMENARKANEAAARIRQVWVFGGITVPTDLPAAKA